MGAERKEAEEALQKSEDRFRALFEATSEPVFIHDENGVVLRANETGSRRLDWPVAHLRGMSLRQIVPPECAEPLDSHLSSALSEGEGSFETTLVSRTGRKIEVEINTRAIEFEGKRALLSVARDVTDQVEREEELRRTQRLDSIAILAGGIAHDFNNILTGILGNITLARMFAKSGKSVEESLEQAEKACGRAEELTRQLLTFAKGGAPVKKVVALGALIRETGEFVLRGSNVRCDLSIPQDLRPAEVDEGQISQVIHNLLINADQAMPQGGVLEVSAENAPLGAGNPPGLPEGNYLKIVLKDHGVGIAKENLPKVFDPYFTTRDEGRGLGLATAHTIIKRHHGAITVESELDVGTTFALYLPASEKAPHVAPQQTGQPLTGSGNVLLMDDEEVVLKTAGAMLKHLGYDVESARDGREAIELFRRAMRSGRPFAAVILDLTVPGLMGGEECLRELVKIDPEVRALASSGYPGDADSGADRGFDGFVTKPYSLEELSQALHRLIAGSGN